MSNPKANKNAITIIFKTGFLLFLIFFSSAKSSAQIYEQKDKAFEKAKVENKPVFLLFSGSDWCMPCIKFEKKILNNPEFQKFSKKHLVVLEADFPQRKVQSKELAKQNDVLAEKYNPQGYFPHLVLLSADGNVLTNIDYINQSPGDFIKEFEPYLHKKELKTIKKQVFLMGSGFEITIVDSGVADGWEKVRESIAEIKRIEALISSWDTSSETYQINTNAGISPVVVDKELYGLIERSLAISKLTKGAFDITFSGLGDLYTFDKNTHQMPGKNQLAQAMVNVGYQHVELLPESKIFINQKNIKIGFGAIGKGYAADKTKQLLIAKGVKNGVINASGDLTVWGKQADGKPWKVGIANPVNKKEILFWLPVENKSVATSGDYEKYFTSDGVRYGHIINPLTGYPVTGMMSVTVISPSAELSDALATSVFVLGVKDGMDLIEQMEGVSCIIIVDLTHIYFSEDLKTDFPKFNANKE